MENVDYSEKNFELFSFHLTLLLNLLWNRYIKIILSFAPLKMVIWIIKLRGNGRFNFAPYSCHPSWFAFKKGEHGVGKWLKKSHFPINFLKMSHLNVWILAFLSIQNVKVARFARSVEKDFFCDFQTLWSVGTL